MPDVNTNQQFFNPLLFAMGSSGSSSAQLDKNRSLSAGLFFLPAELQMWFLELQQLSCDHEIKDKRISDILELISWYG